MDISLNITTSPQTMRKQLGKRSPATTTDKNKNTKSLKFDGGTKKTRAMISRKRPLLKSYHQESGAKSIQSTSPGETINEKSLRNSKDLAFEFGKGSQKVKAIARKRPLMKLNNTESPFTSILNSSPAAKANVKTPAISNKFAFQFGDGTEKARVLDHKKNPAVIAKQTVSSKPTTTLENVPNKPTPKFSKALKPKSLTAVSKAFPKSVAKQNTSLIEPLKESNYSAPAIMAKKSIALKRKHTDIPAEGPKNHVQLQHNDTNLPSSHINITKPAIQEELTLNVCTVPPSGSSLRPKPKQRISRMERLNQKHKQRKGLVTSRALTQQEIDDGIRRFSENPNKQPRAGDLLNEIEQKERDALELGKVDPNARKMNAFRMRRPQDSSVKKIALFKNNPEAKQLGQRFVKPITERIFDGTKVDTLGLHPHAVKNLEDLLSITELTTVQQKTIPEALQGKDILVRSQTGSGKTLAYALPVVEKLQEIRPKLTRTAGILAVVIVPTRELAIQTYELLQKLVKPFTWIVPGVLMGGERRKAEKARLRKGINILVGTPGRLVDHLLHTESFKLSEAKFLVLDEADRLLEMGYERDVKQIVEAIDKQRAELAEKTGAPLPQLQRLLLSATLTAAVQKLAGLTLHEPMFIDNSDGQTAKPLNNTQGYTKESIEAAAIEPLDDEDQTGVLTIPENLRLNYLVVPPKLRLVTLSGLLAKEFVGVAKCKAIVFMSTMEMVNFHHDLLNELLTQKVLDEDDENVTGENEKNEDEGEQPLLMGLRFFKLHGSMTQTERQGVFKSFRSCKTGVLLATDVVERGIDVPEVDLVVQYTAPQTTADFVHRVGRTARAGRSGRSVLFLAPSEAKFVRYLEDKRIRISQVDADIYLKALTEADDEARTNEEAASRLQYKFQELIADDKELHDKACKAFVSWMKFYCTFPKSLKTIFNIKNAHRGHFAKSFGLKEPPTSFTMKHSAPKPGPSTNRLTYTERDPEKMKLEKRANMRRFATTVTGNIRNKNPSASNRLFKMMPNSRALNISEFDSGLPAPKKRKT